MTVQSKKYGHLVESWADECLRRLAVEECNAIQNVKQWVKDQKAAAGSAATAQAVLD